MNTAAHLPKAHRIADVIAHPITAKLTRPTSTSWGTYTEVSIVIVEVRTETGIVGVGETLARFGPKAYAEVIERLLKPRLVGQNACNIAALWESMRKALSGRSGGMLIEAIAGVDIALWDILGKVAGLPISTLLGGAGRTEVPCYAASVNWVDEGEATEELQTYMERGFTRVKVKLAGPVPEAVKRVEAMRAVAGDGISLCVDCNWAFKLDEAIRVGHALAANGYAWFEEPLKPEDEDGYETLSKRVDVPLAAGESNYTLDQAKRLVSSRTLSVLQPDVARSGGISETRRMVEFARAHDVEYAAHIGMSGIICETASVHLAAAMPNAREMECETDFGPFKTELADLSPGCVRMKDGMLSVPAKPGLGLELDWDAVARMRSA
ncbi:mandelate racemase/muconate lactonizing enzyme family protein [Pseudoruegeria sp. HB172150]|uniref:mandelate racemase/muconate lactonizing enzyme family protein n=1 Tax=Pseudoruegeria sp. HB172150 TaxID=2721164 RepID=UPI0015579EC6|nr:mandelate racemase/muconate lactonizing enzyme family protein [Pseudoruegeria sp. HB172150]